MINLHFSAKLRYCQNRLIEKQFAIPRFMAARKQAAGSRKTTKQIPPEYKMIKSIESPSLGYVSKRMGEIVSEEMLEGWLPFGSPMITIEGDNYVMVQAMTKGIDD